MRIPFAIPPTAPSRSTDVAGLGQNSVDLVAVLAEHPTGGRKQRLQRFARHAGGQIATALVACRRLGWSARYIGRFGDDELGRLSRESLEREGVDVMYATVVPGAPNRFAIVLVDARNGERTILWDRDPALAMDASSVPVEAIASARMLLVDAEDVPASAHAARSARRAGVPTVADIDKVRPGLGELLPHIDALIVAADFPAALTGIDDLGRAVASLAREYGSPLVCATLGAEGSLAWCGGREIRTRAFPVDCVDTTGAGDVFRGGFAAACLRAPHGSIEDVLAYANAAAALNCRALGARGALPAAAEVEQMLDAASHM